MRRITILIILVSLIITGCSSQSVYVNKKESQFLIGTIVTLNLYHEDESILNATTEEIINKIKSLELIFSRRLPTSELYKLNASDSLTNTVSPQLQYLIEKSLYYSNLSQGYFDVTTLPIINLWGIDSDAPRVPMQDEITRALTKIGSDNIYLKGQDVEFQNYVSQIDLGGIAKGYITDEIVKILVANDIPFAIIDLGGNLYVHGQKDGVKDWTLGIRDPEGQINDILGTLTLSDSSLVTSGGYERFFESEGKTYHHILDPFTGYPVNSDLKSVSIISPSSIDCDALSTAVFSIGLEKGLELIESLENTECILVTTDNKIRVTSGLKDKFQVVSETYVLQ